MLSERVERVESYHEEFAVREEEGVEEAMVDLGGRGEEEGEIGEGAGQLSQNFHSCGEQCLLYICLEWNCTANLS